MSHSSSQIWPVVVLFALLNLAWELLQLPFYTIWREESVLQIAYAIFHCTAGDLLIGTGAAAGSILILEALRLGTNSTWPFLACFVLPALAYTVFSEWMNVDEQKNWAYSPWMPLLPPFGTGLTPLLQWIIVPGLTWRLAGEPVRLRLAGRPVDTGGSLS